VCSGHLESYAAGCISSWQVHPSQTGQINVEMAKKMVNESCCLESAKFIPRVRIKSNETGI
jgi:hypothetical protein